MDYTKSGTVATLNFDKIDGLNDISIRTKLNTHKHGRDYHHRIGEIGLKIGLEYSKMNTIVRRLFDINVKYLNKILSLETKEVYAFVLNNTDKLKDDIRHAMADILIQEMLKHSAITPKLFVIPQEHLFTFDGTAKTQIEYTKNVYKGYLSSAEIRSASEKKFEKYCENCANIEWFYKNGDKGAEYFSVVYEDNFGKQKSFYPDYIVGTKDGIWIIETKGGFDRTGKSEDIDLFSPKKFNVLNTYLKKYKLKGGFVREDKQSLELCICMENYNDDIKSDSWILLSDIL